jgi:hypothetical protein
MPISHLFASLVAASASLPQPADFRPRCSGDFVITGSEPAPWADAERGAASAESARLQGKTVSFQPKAITGPAPFPCKNARYEIEPYEADMLFQGGLTKPDSQAAALGFTPGKIPTVETGCEIEFHFMDQDHAMVALDNRIYHLQRSNAGAR